MHGSFNGQKLYADSTSCSLSFEQQQPPRRQQVGPSAGWQSKQRCMHLRVLQKKAPSSTEQHIRQLLLPSADLCLQEQQQQQQKQQ
jgi:hypothetical protein